MVKISRAQGAGAASNYFEKEYSNARESYYTEGGQEEVQGEYFGQLAAELGLAGRVSAEDFHRLIEGQDPTTGRQLIRHVASKTYTDKLGKEIKTSEHRAGWDIVFSCPKSISLAAGPGGDRRIPGLQREAVVETLREIEKYVAGKDGHRGHHTGKMVAAIFQHDCARPDRETGYAAPDIHDHVFVMNMTRDETGKFRALEIDSLFRVRDFATHLHWSRLVEKMEAIGYEFERNPQTGAPEIKGISAEYLAENSKRRDEVLRNEARLKLEAKRAGFTVKGKSLRGKAARMNRRSKKFDRMRMQIRHLAVDAEFGFQAHQAVEHARLRGPVIHQSDEIRRRAQEAVTFARDHVFEREAVALRTEIERQALRRGLGLTTYGEIKAEVDRRIEAGELLEIERGRGPELTSKRMLDLERDNIRRVIRSKDTQKPVINAGAIGQAIEKAEEKTGVSLNDSQRKAVTEILRSRDQIMGLSGVAGAGKTTTLATLNHILTDAGYDVRGFAPLTKAANQLGESGIQTTTLQKFLASPKAEREEGNRYFILDETSLAGTQSVNQFLNRLGENDRVLLVGDERQHQSIQAGAAFEQLQGAGMQTAKLDKIVRQKTEKHREIVRRLYAKDVRAAIDRMIEQGHVTEIGDRSERLKSMASDYCSNPDAIVICLRNSERKEVNDLIHQQLQKEGKIKGKSIEATILVERDVTGAERRFAGAYEVGDIIRYRDGSKVYGIERGAYRRVIKVNLEQNTITVQTEKGKSKLTYDPRRLSGVSVYREEARQFSEGDKIQFRAPFQEQRIATNEIGTITAIKGGKLTVKADKGRQVIVDVRAYRHLDLGYAVTSISAQGQTAYRGIFSVDTHESSLLLNERTAYVANSRAIHETRIYTNSIEELPAALDRKRDKEMATTAIWETGKARARREPAVEERQRQSAQGERPASLQSAREQQTQAPRTLREAPGDGARRQQPRAETRKAEPWLAQLLAEDRNKVGEVIRALEQVAGVGDGMKRNIHPHSQQRAKDINAWVRYCSPMSENLSVIPGMPLDGEIKRTLIEAVRSLHRMTQAYGNGQNYADYVAGSVDVARDALSRVEPDLLTWELARSVSRVNGNFQTIEKLIRQGGRVEKLWMYGEPGENNLSVFTVRNLPGTYTAHMYGIDKTSMGFDERVSSFGYGDPPDSSRVKEIEYNPPRIRAEQMEQTRAQAHQIERGQGQSRDRGGYGYSR